ncbi:hypothetical protein [Yinghuangia sp. YIM S10712]|uniref:hypothetical protein n=1 Tax=Yinghuangia sp. YIM S10712 TaxID=3436930 RepID=UPI003F53A5A8
MDNGIIGTALMLRHLDADGVSEVLARLVSSEGVDAVAEVVRNAPAPGEAFVAGVLAAGESKLRRALAGCRQLTPDQVRRVLRHGGPDVEVADALFPNRRADSAFTPARPLPSLSALTGPAAAEAALLDERCPDDLADALLERFPHLAYVVRNQHPGYVRFLRGDRRPISSLTAGEISCLGLADGGLGLAEIVGHMRPAASALSALSGVVARRPWLSAELRVLLAPRLTEAIGSDPGLWSELAARLGSFDGTIAELIGVLGDKDSAAEQVVVPDERVGEMSFLLLRLPGDQLTSLLPALPQSVRRRLGRDAVADDAELLTDVAFATRDLDLLCGLAERPSLTPEATARLVGLDDAAVNRALAGNRRVAAAVRHRIFCGIPHGSDDGRLPIDPGLRELDAYAEPETLIACGDPVLALGALTGRPRLRVADRIAVAIAVWERGGGELLCRVPVDAFRTTVARLVETALAEDSPQALYGARDRHSRKAVRASSTVPAPAPGYHASEQDWERQMAVTASLESGQLTPELVIHDVNPAHHAVHALHQLAHLAGAHAVDEALAAQVDKYLNGRHRADAWAVLFQLLPEFGGSLHELLVVCSAVAD